MLFNSIDFLVFFPVIFVLYWFVLDRNLRLQNLLLLVASYYFYACWDWRFLFLLMFSTFLDFFTGIKMESAGPPDRKRFWFWTSIVVNLGFLAVFKYYDFFATSFSEFLTRLGFSVDMWALRLILPVGISFYTFHGLSYVIDIYNGRIKAERNAIDYAVFVSYFPLLVAGPIERATHLLPQIKARRSFDYSQSINGLELILWGLFKKVVIADNLAIIVNQVYSNSGEYGWHSLVIATFAFCFQIYGDFSGYSDIAIGTSKLLGIDLLRNFNFPYLSRSIAEFWKRWHISLSTWFRDYLYIPLGGSRGSLSQNIRNVFVIFLVSGFWHGANWTFILWGAIHAVYFIPSFIMGTHKRFQDDLITQHRPFPKVGDLAGLAITFFLVSVAWIFFRSSSVEGALQIVKDIGSLSNGVDIVVENNQP